MDYMVVESEHWSEFTGLRSYSWGNIFARGWKLAGSEI